MTGMVVKRIPKEVLDAAHLKLCRATVACIVIELRDSGLSIEKVAARLDKNPESIRQWILRMLDGNTHELRTISDLVCAIGSEIQLSVHRFPPEVLARMCDEIEEPPE